MMLAWVLVLGDVTVVLEPRERPLLKGWDLLRLSC